MLSVVYCVLDVAGLEPVGVPGGHELKCAEGEH